MENKKILLIINEFNSLFDFRKEFVESLQSSGFTVFLVGPKSGKYQYFADRGCIISFVDLNRRGKSIFKDWIYHRQLKKIIKSINPLFVFSYSIKPNLHSGMICKRYKIPYVATITGLGTAFSINKLVTFALKILLRNSLKKAKRVFCQNSYIADFFINNKIAKPNQIVITSGSGVNLEEHHYSEMIHSENINMLYAGRMVKNKGVVELLEAFDEVCKKYTNIYLTIAGAIESSEYEGILNSYITKNQKIKYIGFSNNVDDLIYSSTVVVVPSYAEGMSNILQESLACGRPVLASDIPGCKEICLDGITGFCFLPKNKDSLYNAIMNFLSLPFDRIKEMGHLGRIHVENNFDRKKVVDKYMGCLIEFN